MTNPRVNAVVFSLLLHATGCSATGHHHAAVDMLDELLSSPDTTTQYHEADEKARMLRAAEKLAPMHPDAQLALELEHLELEQSEPKPEEQSQRRLNGKKKDKIPFCTDGWDCFNCSRDPQRNADKCEKHCCDGGDPDHWLCEAINWQCEEPEEEEPEEEDPWTWGDPHFRTWHGHSEFEYHGECDLVLVKAPTLDMDIHIRTTIRYDYSFISQAAVRIGDEVFEVASWGEYQLDGMSSVDLPAFIGGYPITLQDVDQLKKKYKFVIHIDGNMVVSIVSFKDYVSVKIEHGTQDKFEGVTGIMGDFTGVMYARDGSVLEDPEVYAPEWQVRPDEDGILFSGDRFPQYPQKCVKPSPSAIHARKLGEAAVSQEEAEAACASWKTARKSCIQDVLKTGDLDVALLI